MKRHLQHSHCHNGRNSTGLCQPHLYSQQHSHLWRSASALLALSAPPNTAPFRICNEYEIETPFPNYTLWPTQHPRHLTIVGNVDRDGVRTVDAHMRRKAHKKLLWLKRHCLFLLCSLLSVVWVQPWLAQLLRIPASSCLLLLLLPLRDRVYVKCKSGGNDFQGGWRQWAWIWAMVQPGTRFPAPCPALCSLPAPQLLLPGDREEADSVCGEKWGLMVFPTPLTELHQRLIVGVNI